MKKITETLKNLIIVGLAILAAAAYIIVYNDLKKDEGKEWK